MGRPPRSLEERFWKCVERRADDECWPWRGARHHTRYGVITRPDGRQARAHRVSWELAYGPVPDGMLVCHSCDNPPCVNPHHLWVGSGIANIQDRNQKRRTARGDHVPFGARPRGERHWSKIKPDRIPRGEMIPQAKLNEDSVRLIFALSAQGWTQQAIANHVGVQQATISKVIRRKVWQHIRLC